VRILPSGILGLTLNVIAAPAVPVSVPAHPMIFEPEPARMGQASGFVSRGLGYGLRLDARGATLGIGDSKPVRLEWLGARRDAAPEGADLLPSESNYFVGKDPVTASVAGTPAEIVSADMAPGEVSVCRVKLRVPAVDAGSQSLLVAVGDVQAPAVGSSRTES
jgi:hypothetical protein